MVVIVEIFSCSYPNFTDSVYTEVLKPDNKISDIKFAGKNTELMIDRGDYYLLFKKNCFQDYDRGESHRVLPDLFNRLYINNPINKRKVPGPAANLTQGLSSGETTSGDPSPMKSNPAQ